MDGHIQKCAFCQWNRGDPTKKLPGKAFPKAQHWALLLVAYAIGSFYFGKYYDVFSGLPIKAWF